MLGDFIVDQTGLMWVCTVTGTPGTWVRTAQTGSQLFTSSGSFTVPAGIYRIFVKAWGGGGGGGPGGTIAYSNTYGTGGGGGGGSGGYAGVWLSVTPAQVIIITIGAGGASGVAGGLTTLGSIMATGGTQGATGGTSAAGTGGTYGTGGVSNYGTSGVTGNPGTAGGNGGTSTYGYGGWRSHRCVRHIWSRGWRWPWWCLQRHCHYQWIYGKQWRGGHRMVKEVLGCMYFMTPKGLFNQSQ
ncbi:hypothetical protein SBF1_4460001 [Candidatus Desulfosporosinus infrequens]|uniref:Glycine-rich domain-containing protein n=1 Tax=Candidatus Desulfosporosinus infrequens TaxID=2043169 RepID=A0A2U3LBK6_9FIRM|nr:hypothetical protein SBF1_4460001 [Candidatus Desulfosporosinus infrequens]